MADATRSPPHGRARAAVALVILLSFSLLPAAPAAALGPAAEDGLVPRGPLHVHGDADLAAQAAAEEWPGDGSATSPYRVAGYAFAQGLGGPGACWRSPAVCIVGTRAHLVVEASRFEGGVQLYDVENITLRGNVREGGTVGYFLDGIFVGGARRVLVEDNVVVRAGIEGQNLEESAIRSNRVGSARYGIGVENFGILGGAPITIEGNVITGGGCGVLLASAPGGRIVGNVIRGGNAAVCTSYGHYHIEGNVVEGAQFFGISTSGHGSTIADNRVNGTGQPINVYGAHDVRVLRNVVSNVRYGDFGIRVGHSVGWRVEGNEVRGFVREAIRVHDSRDGATVGNLVTDARIGIGFAASSDALVDGNRFERVGERGWTDRFAIAIGSGSADFRVEDNVVAEPRGPALLVEGATRVVAARNVLGTFSDGGVVLRDATGSTIEENVVGPRGVQLLRSSGNAVRANDVANGTIALVDSDANEVRANRAVGGAVTLERSSRNVVADNLVGGAAGVAVGVTLGEENIVSGNAIRGSAVGVHLAWTRGTTIASNVIEDNGLGLHLENAEDGLLYDNFLANERNAFVEGASGGGGNRWNVEKTPGINVVGGPFLGGNYWSDATTVDVDADGLGEAPHGALPEPPAVEPAPGSRVNPVGLALLRADEASAAAGAPLGLRATLYDVAHHGPNDLLPLACGFVSLQPTPLGPASCVPRDDFPALPGPP